MKKTYITPDMRSIELGLEMIIAGSGNEMPVNTGTSAGAGESLSRDAAEPSSSSLWDAEW